ncbi:MAG: formimidoylglutamase [Bacteroidales bacterium]|nr:formimidoylglutamase [Bacteroidales bacterium]
MELSGYFEPIDPRVVDYEPQPFHAALGEQISVYAPGQPFPNPEEASIVLLGVAEDRRSLYNRGCAIAPDHIRHYLYRLAPPHPDTRIADLGNLAPGATPEDTYAAVAEVAGHLLSRGCTLLLLGGSDDLVFPLYKAYASTSSIINICSVDSRFNLDGGDTINSENYLQHIILQQPNYLFDYMNLGYQSYFVGQEMTRLMEELKFTTHRVGEIQPDLERSEPIVRYADLVAVDVSALRQSDAPANANPSPHGFYGEQLCQIARYAGMSDKTSCFGLFELNPAHDRSGQTAHLYAHAAWFFIEGYHYRLGDFPRPDSPQYKRFTVPLEGHGLDIIFYKSLRTDRWWMEVPCQAPPSNARYQRHSLIPCNYSDYQQALENDIPELWWHYYNRFNG